MKVVIEIEMTNSAFDDGYGGLKELHRLLELAVQKVGQQLGRPMSICDAPEAADKLLDFNGNTVGSVVVERDKVCIHGVEDGCDITCSSCTHTCRRHITGVCLSRDEVPGFCGCDSFEGTEG